MINAWKKQDNYDETITDHRILELTGRAYVLQGVYRYDTIEDLTADANMLDILNDYAEDYWQVSGGQLVWR